MIELIKRTRSYRRFDESRHITEELLLELIDCARLGGSARNQQPWQYTLINSPPLCELVFPHLGWAGYLSDWKGPATGEKPTAYLLCLLNQDWLKGSGKEAHFDLGIATQNILLCAMEKGIGGCRIGAFSPKLKAHFEIPANLELSLIIALGYPAEEVVVTDLSEENDIRYFRNEKDVHVVPKRTRGDLIVNLAPR